MSLLAAPPHPSVTFPRLLLASVDAYGPSFAGWVGSDASGDDLWLRLEPQRSHVDGGADDDGGDNDARRPPPPSSSLRTSCLLLSPALQRALRGHEDAVAARLRQSKNASEFFAELRTLLEAVGVASSCGRGGRRRRKRGNNGASGGGGSSCRSSCSSLLSSAFYSALLDCLGPRAWKSMTAMRESAAAAESGDGGGGGAGEAVLLSFAVRAAGDGNGSSPPPSPLRVTLALDPATFPRSAPRLASVDLPPALLRPPLALPIASWWNKSSGGGGSSSRNASAATASSSKSKLDDVLSWLLAAAGSRAASAAFAALDQLDAQAWILDPPLPAPRARTSRRVAAAEGGRASVEVDFVTFFAFSSSASSSDSSSSLSFLPAPKFGGWLGPEALVAPLREAAEASATGRAWDPSRGAVENLEALLLQPSTTEKSREGQQQQRQRLLLPRKPGSRGGGPAASDAERGEDTLGLGDGAECAICCAFRLDDDGDGGGGGGEGREGEGVGAGAAATGTEASPPSSSLPSVSCENERCGRPFHASCLREWLVAASGGGSRGVGGREVATGAGGGGGGGGGGGVLRGQCPYCSEPISVLRSQR